jgi:hypothetical protein
LDGDSSSPGTRVAYLDHHGQDGRDNKAILDRSVHLTNRTELREKRLQGRSCRSYRSSGVAEWMMGTGAVRSSQFSVGSSQGEGKQKTENRIQEARNLRYADTPTRPSRPHVLTSPRPHVPTSSRPHVLTSPRRHVPTPQSVFASFVTFCVSFFFSLPQANSSS